MQVFARWTGPDWFGRGADSNHAGMRAATGSQISVS
jgi:hypothetical protein